MILCMILWIVFKIARRLCLLVGFSLEEQFTDLSMFLLQIRRTWICVSLSSLSDFVGALVLRTDTVSTDRLFACVQRWIVNFMSLYDAKNCDIKSF